jgi:hypothetical protein
MKIGFTGIDLPAGKTKYQDEKLEALAAKDKPKKVSPYFAEFIPDEFVQVDAIVVPKEKILDLLIYDLESLDGRRSRADDPSEIALLEKCIGSLEEEIPLCDVDFSEVEAGTLGMLGPYSFKPVAQIEKGTEVNQIIAQAIDKAGLMFFYTSGPQESHAWLVEKDSDIVDCAAKIHSDLARGFIKGDVVGFDEYMSCHSFNDCKSKGVAKLVDRGYAVQPGEVIEIRFSV